METKTDRTVKRNRKIHNYIGDHNIPILVTGTVSGK
jgi:hypothetical protein